MPRYILTGAPGAGKTVLLRGLERAGLAVVEEAATDVIAWRGGLGQEEPWTDPAFCDDILTVQLDRERRAGVGEGVVVFDRSPVCTLALARYIGAAPSIRLIEAAGRPPGEVYAREVFFIEGLDFIVPTAARRIGLEEARAFAVVHRETYEALGYRLVGIAPDAAERRVDQLLHHLRAA